MFTVAFFLFVVIPVVFFAAISLVPFVFKVIAYCFAAVALLLKGIVYGFAVVFLLIKTAVPWIISALYALMFGLLALGRQLFTGENAKAFLEQTLPPREVKHETLSLVLIELMLDFHKKI